MINNKWFCEPDDSRLSWCFLSLRTASRDDSPSISGWEIAYGNPVKIVKVLQSDRGNEGELIKQLLDELYLCKKHAIPVIIYEAGVFSLLRTRIVILDLKGVSLRGVKYVALKRLLDDYLQLDEVRSQSLVEMAEQLHIETHGKSETEILHAVFIRLGPVLPSGVI